MIGKLSVKSKVLVMVFMLFFSVLAGSVTASMESPVCGDEYLDEGESCDDGLNNGQPNYCNTECTGTTAPMCGNQVIEEGESCDDGDLNGQENYCNTECNGQTIIPDSEPATINSVEITPDGYACSLDSQEENPNSEITISADVTDNEGVAWVKADIGQIVPSELTDFSSNFVDLSYNEDTGRYEYTFTAPETSQYNFESKLITITADDDVENGYQVAEGSSNEASVILYSMTYPQVDSECEEYGQTTSSTNFCNIADWRNVNLIQEVKKYGEPLECNNQEDMPWGEEFRSIFRLEFESLDLADEDVLQKLQKLGEAIKVSIVPPGQAGASYINVDSTYFAELSSPALVSFYGLPMTDEPEIVGPEDRGAAEIDDFYQNEPFQISMGCSDFEELECNEGDEGCECEYMYVPNSDLSFYVEGFSQYDLVDYFNPTVSFIDYYSGENINTGMLTLNVEIDGTGTQLSQIQLLVDGELQTQYKYTDIFSECSSLGDSLDYEQVSCPFDLELSEREHTISIIATDLGGENGNTQQEDLVLVVDITTPTATVEYSTIDLTNENVVATIIPNEEITVTNNEGSTSYTFTENGEFAFEFADAAGNTGSLTATVDNIDTTAPEGSILAPESNAYLKGIVQLQAESTDVNGISTVEFYYRNEVIPNRVGREDTLIGEASLVDDKYTLDWDTTSLADDNYIITAKIYDVPGNSVSYTESITVDNTAPTATVEYSTTKITNGEVISTISPSETVRITNNEDSTSYTFTENGEFTFEFEDTAGNTGSLTATVDNIDTTAPDIKYIILNPAELKTEDTLSVTTKVTDMTEFGLGFSIDDEPIRVESTENAGIYTFSISVERYSIGTHTLKVTATDGFEQVSTKDAAFVISETAAEDSFLDEAVELTKDSNNTVTADGTNTELIIDSTESVTTSIKVKETAEHTSSTDVGIPELGRYIEITAPELEGKMNKATIKVSYTDAEVAAKGLDESTLRLWYYNETSASWMKYDTPDGGVDTTNNYVWASTTHFSTWGVFGTALSSGGSSGGSGGGGGSSRSTVKIPITPINPAALIPQIFRTVVPTVTETTTTETLQTSTTESTNPTTAQNTDVNQGNLLTGAAVSDAGAGVFSSGSWPIYAIGLTVLVLGGSGVYFARKRKVA